MPKKVLIMSASAGTGHVRAAQALEIAFRAHPDIGEVVSTDALEHTNPLFRDIYSKLYTTLIAAAPDLLGWFYEKTDEPWQSDRLRLALDQLNSAKLIEFIRDFQPDLTVCTHFMPAGIIAHLLRHNRIETHLSIVVTDYDFHANWLSRVFHRYFVALDETKAHLVALGLPAERVTVSGIPIHSEFTPVPDSEKSELRRQSGLEPHLPTLLLSAGALSVGPAAQVVARLLTLETPVQTIVVCGRDASLRREVLDIIGGEKNVRFRILGYTQEMHHWMRLSDLFIGKPGGLATSEAMACGLPMAIFHPIPGQEEHNSDHLLENGAAIRCNFLTTLPYKIDLLLSDPARLARMRQATVRLAAPGAAPAIVETLLSDHLEPLFVDSALRQHIAAAAD